jgi:hypothetical protein
MSKNIIKVVFVSDQTDVAAEEIISIIEEFQEE